MSALKFAVVREDPELECALVQKLQARAVLVVASGGCTALTLGARFPALQVTAFDQNPRQLQHLTQKQQAARHASPTHFNVESADPTALNQCGEFEGLFRTLRRFLCEFVTSEAELQHFFAATTAPAERRLLVDKWQQSRYFPVAFELCFHDSLLHAMFGPDATQHARPGSYPGYFQAVFLRGLRREDAADNPFLQHVLLGCYLTRSAPQYLHASSQSGLELVLGSLTDVPRLDRFQLYSLSNIFDWADDRLPTEWGQLLASVAAPGSAVLIRQLNNRRDVRRFFAPAFQFDEALGSALQASDRSLFYERIEVGFRR